MRNVDGWGIRREELDHGFGVTRAGHRLGLVCIGCNWFRLNMGKELASFGTVAGSTITLVSGVRDHLQSRPFHVDRRIKSVIVM